VLVRSCYPADLGIWLTYYFSREECHFGGFYCTPYIPAAETSGTPMQRMAQHQPLVQGPQDIGPNSHHLVHRSRILLGLGRTPQIAEVLRLRAPSDVPVEPPSVPTFSLLTRFGR
jgi:hypothetical protein